MTKFRAWREIPLARMLVAGGAVGAVMLGAGGRVAMAAIQASSNTTPPRFTIGGTVTVIGLGLASGLGGAVMALVSRWIARRLPAAYHATQYLLLAGMLYWITTRGLHGTAPVGRLYFVPLVACYAVVMLLVERRLAPVVAAA